MNYPHEKRMTRQEWRELMDVESQLVYIKEKGFSRQCAAIYPDLDAALGEYMATFDCSGDRGAALEKFDAALNRLRSVYHEYNYDWKKYISDPHVFRSF